ncbi:carboxylic acid reductase [Streptomyces sp. S.PB5]|uniref:carboxylic acid reductase n=1 Tax=Streptomyces sp. S.PB5 TaxID=3020844 RepID=UPI0025AF4CBC|nr:carboxylic acid reductase [Streptomyces sp. S.PB5]MDN3025851.1 thioester reductase domain-containing protein [Streptomyces sp. S.PB5]
MTHPESMAASDRQRWLAERIAALRVDDPEFAGAIPSVTVADGMRRAEGSLADTVSAAMTGYIDRPALAQRAREVVTDRTTGRASLELLPRFDAITYGELWSRVGALAGAWTTGVSGGFTAGDFVAVLGFTGIDYATIDLTCMVLGAVSVPLPRSASAAHLAPVVDETRPRILAADVESVGIAVDVVLRSDSIERLVVFDYDGRVDDHRETFAAVVDRLHGRATVVTFSAELERGQGRSAISTPADSDPDRTDSDPDRLAGLIYTSGSTGTPKGAMYTEGMLTQMWQRSRGGMTNAGASGDAPLPTIVLHYMPMSHANGRSWLVSGLASGGIGFFVGRSDLSTLFEDISLARPTVLSLVPRICDMVFQLYQIEAERYAEQGTEDDSAHAAARAEIRDRLLGGRILSALCGSAPLSGQMRDFMESVLGITVTDCYGSTETGRPVVVNQQVRRPPVIDYKLVDVPELGYFQTDRPYPRGELRLKSDGLVHGYFRQPEATARAFDEDGYYRTGDIMAEVAPDRLVYVDRINNVVKLSQGEFVEISRLEALYSSSPCIEQIYLYGSSEQAFLLAVVVPDFARIGSSDTEKVRSAVSDSIRRLAAEAELNPYEIPNDFLLEPDRFSVANGLLSGVGKHLRPELKARYGEQLECMYQEIADRRAGLLARVRATGGSRPTLDTVTGTAQVALGLQPPECQPDQSFRDLGGDSLSAHTFSTMLGQVFGIEIPIQVIIGPTATLSSIAAYVDTVRGSEASRPSFASVHGRDSSRVSAADLKLGTFIDAGTLARATRLPRAADSTRTVLLTGANGFLGRFLCLEWLERFALTGGKLICIARGHDDAAARQRIEDAFTSGSAELDERFATLADRHLEVLAGDVSAPRLGLRDADWDRLAGTVDQIVHSAALVNHVLPYAQLFEPNVVGTAELIRLALTTRRKRFGYISTVGVAMLPDGSFVGEDADIRTASAVRPLDDTYANGYATSKWAGEVLLREAHERCGLPVAVFRSDMILAHSRFAGQLNVPDRFTRLLLSVVATGVAPRSFYAMDADGRRRRAHYSGLPVDFTAAAVVSLGETLKEGHSTYNVVNNHDDGVSLDQFVDWLIELGCPITRIDDYQDWRSRFEIALKALPERQRKLSLLPLIHAYDAPARPVPGALVPAERFHATVRDCGVGGDQGVPHLSMKLIEKYVADLRLLALL